jgi:hypothetical protein
LLFFFHGGKYVEPKKSFELQVEYPGFILTLSGLAALFYFCHDHDPQCSFPRSREKEETRALLHFQRIFSLITDFCEDHFFLSTFEKCHFMSSDFHFLWGPFFFFQHLKNVISWVLTSTLFIDWLI